MTFSSFQFMIFFLVVFGLTWTVRREVWRQRILLAASYIFYGYWDYRFLALMGGVTALAYMTGLALDHRRFTEHRRVVLGLALTGYLGTLGVFKYFNFFMDNFALLLARFGWSEDLGVMRILLPAGISFYIFHSISYNIDVYRRIVASERSFERVALYIAFFPQLVAGPIVRAAHFLPQMHREKHFSRWMLLSGLRLFLVGFVYKVAVADNLAAICDPIFRKPEHFDNIALIIATLSFHSQIYFDFAGYSCMAIGVARCFGYRIPKNFDFPYAAVSITDFWRRWHMSLSFWLRDYLFIPLGGNRGGHLSYYRNLMLTMVLGGIWHGANWTFIAWGGMHGAALCLHKAVSPFLPRGDTLAARPLLRLVLLAGGFVLTQLWVLLAWAMFRAETIADSQHFAGAFLGIRSDFGLESQPWPLFFLILPVMADHVLGNLSRSGHLRKLRSPVWFWFAVGAVCALILATFPISSGTFIYFQF